MTRKRFAWIDTEFYATRERDVVPVCAVIKGRTFKTPMFFWLHENPSGRHKLAQFLREIRDEYILGSWQFMAEARCLLACGIDPAAHGVIDLWIEWKQLQNCNNAFLYGPHIDAQGNETCSVPPGQVGPSHAQIGTSLAEVVYFAARARIDREHKDQMRDRIIKGGPFTADESRAILAYCAEDTEYLPIVWDAIRKWNPYLTPETALLRGRYSVALAKSERQGIPLNMERVDLLRRNQPQIVDTFIRSAVAVYPFWIKDHKKGTWVQSYDQFARFIEDAGAAHNWPRSPASRKFVLDEKTISKMTGRLRDPRHRSALKAFQSAKKSVSHVGTFSAARLPKFLERVGSDGRLRPWFNPFGSQTGRNQPPSSHFIFAMASWLRCLIEPPEGHVIVGCDYSAQEFAVAAALANDKNMLAAYNSGDPYLGYAKLAGVVPSTATRETHDEVRGELKSSVLGIQFGQGASGLATKVSDDTGKHVSKAGGERLLRLHKRTFPDYWALLQKIDRIYEGGTPLRTRDNWILFGDNPNRLSWRNMLIQGNAASIGRESVCLAWENDLPIISPLHDCDYGEFPIADAEDMTRRLITLMDQAVETILGTTVKIRIDAKAHHRGELWVESKAKKTIEALGPYLDSFDEWA